MPLDRDTSSGSRDLLAATTTNRTRGSAWQQLHLRLPHAALNLCTSHVPAQRNPAPPSPLSDTSTPAPAHRRLATTA